MVSTTFEKLQRSRERGQTMHTYSLGPLTEIGSHAWNIGEDNGWHKHSDTFDTYIAGIAAEVGEAINAFRDRGLERSTVTNVIGYDHVTGEPILQEPGKPEGVGPELADIVIRVCHLAHFLGIDLDTEVVEKTEYNRSRKRHLGMRFDN